MPAQCEDNNGAELTKEERLIAENMDDSVGVFVKFLRVDKQQVCTKGFQQKRPGPA